MATIRIPEWLCKLVTNKKHLEDQGKCALCGKTLAQPPAPVPDTTPPTEKPEEKPDTGDSSQHPKPVHDALFRIDGATQVTMGKGGMRVNPDNAHGRCKIIFGSRYEHAIARVTAWDGKGGMWELHLMHPHESPGNRERCYMPMPAAETPRKLWVRFDCVVNGSAVDYFTVIEDSHQEIG